MNETNLSHEEKEKYENEFCDFLTERIKHVGGSLQFQHLMSLLPQLNSETEKAVGPTKSELMRFLRAHNKFEVNGKGIVSIVDTSISDADSNSNNKQGANNQINSLPSTIQEGMGVICRIHPEFGFINALEPLETSVYFAASAFGGDKDDLLTDFDLKIGTEVYFNAVKGPRDCDAKYRAIKVWRQHTTDDEEVLEGKKHKKNKLEGVGKVKKILPEIGFISVDEMENNTVFFHRTNFVDCSIDEDLTKILRPGDSVVFSAVESQKKDSKAQWQAIEVFKYVKRPIESLEQDQISNRHRMKKEIIKNQSGKIYPHTNGSTIKFGEKFSESANGDSSVYFLYGAQVTDIPWEFSLGDDVYFDAVKVKSGWKAILVWVGERPDFVLPTCLGDFSEFIDEDFDDKDDQKSTSSSSVYFSESYNSSEWCSDIKSISRHPSSKQSKREKNFESDGHFSSKNKNEFEKTCRKNKTQSSRDSSLNSYTSRELKVFKKQKGGQKNELSNLNKIKDDCAKSVRNSDRLNHGRVLHLKFKKLSNISNELRNQNQMVDYTEHENYPNPKMSSLRNKELKDKSTKHIFLSAAQEQTNIEYENKGNVSKGKQKVILGKASIKTFESINGTVTNVLCKLAFVENSELQEEILFSSSVFYSSGRSVEEHQAEDLREIIRVGDTIKINCFEIVDDYGDFHHQVTMAWRGTKPEINEMTPDEFIKRKELSVTVEDKSDKNSIKEDTHSSKFLVADSDCDSEYLSDCQDESVSSHSSSFEIASCSNNVIPEVYEYRGSDIAAISASIHNRLLHEKISDRLRSKGLFFSDSEVDLDAVSTEIIDLVLADHKIKACDNHQVQVKVRDSVCSSCLKKKDETFSTIDVKSQHKEAQTIITGDIVAQIPFKSE